MNEIVVRQMLKKDLLAVMKIKEAESWNQTIEDWEMFMNFNSDLCLVAVYESKVVGTVTAINYKNQVAWIGMMLVSKEFRGLGISKRLLTKLIDRLRACKSIKLDATKAGAKVYKKLGFKEELNISRMTTKKLSVQASPSLDDSVRLLKKEDLKSLVNADLDVFGADRSKLLNILINGGKDKGWCIERENNIVGYVLLRAGSNYTQIGPLVADSVTDAKALLVSVLTYLKEKPVVVDILYDKVALIKWLESLGFVKQRAFIRMYLKNNESPGITQKQFLIAGPELG